MNVPLPANQQQGVCRVVSLLRGMAQGAKSIAVAFNPSGPLQKAPLI